MIFGHYKLYYHKPNEYTDNIFGRHLGKPIVGFHCLKNNESVEKFFHHGIFTKKGRINSVSTVQINTFFDGGIDIFISGTNPKLDFSGFVSVDNNKCIYDFIECLIQADSIVKLKNKLDDNVEYPITFSVVEVNPSSQRYLQIAEISNFRSKNINNIFTEKFSFDINNIGDLNKLKFFLD